MEKNPSLSPMESSRVACLPKHYRVRFKVSIIRDLLFADDCSLNTSTEVKMQSEVYCMSVLCDDFGLDNALAYSWQALPQTTHRIDGMQPLH